MQAVSNSLPHHASRVWSFGGGLRLRDRAASEQLCDVSASISLNGPTEPPLIEAPQPALLWAAPPPPTHKHAFTGMEVEVKALQGGGRSPLRIELELLPPLGPLWVCSSSENPGR